MACAQNLQAPNGTVLRPRITVGSIGRSRGAALAVDVAVRLHGQVPAPGEVVVDLEALPVGACRGAVARVYVARAAVEEGWVVSYNW